MDEAKKLFELECGRASLPTVFGLYMLFFVSAMMGKDRAGLMYRYMVCSLNHPKRYYWSCKPNLLTSPQAQHMLKQLRLERRFEKLDEAQPDHALERDIISRSLWGLFATER